MKLKGHVKLELFDAKTKKLVKKVEDHNAFTSALNTLVNGGDFGLGKQTLGNTAFSGTGITDHSPIAEVALGGIQLFEDYTNPNDLDDLYEPIENEPVAYASRLNPTISGDRKIGVFNVNESSISLDRKSVTQVFDWATSQGNGDIGVVSLSHLNCLRFMNDPAYFLTSSGLGEYKAFSSTYVYGALFGVGNGGIFVRDKVNPNTISFYRINDTKLDLTTKWGNPVYSSLPTPDWTKTYTLSPAPSVCYDRANNKVYLVSCSGGTSASMIVIDPANNWAETSVTISINDSMRSTAFNDYSWGRNMHDINCVHNGYLYCFKSDLTALLKIDLSDTSQVTSIAFPAALSVDNTAWGICSDGVLVYVVCTNNNRGSYIVSDANTLIALESDFYERRPLYRKGVWMYMTTWDGNRSNLNIGRAVLAPYNATKFELDNVVQKTAENTMKVSYTITEVSGQ